ncbi:MAG: hypothetical protein C4311_07005 [Chloroflexota bacterium]
MVREIIVSRPESSVEALIASGRRNRCACCGGPVVPVIEYRGPQDERQGYYLCNSCKMLCEVGQTEAGERRFIHHTRQRLDWERADRRWATDLGFKRLGT